jgi:predicted dehydrogenase
MSKTLRAALIGAGAIAVNGHIPAYQQAEGVEIAAICDVNSDRVAKVAAEIGIPGAFTDYKDMLATVKPDLVSVCSPNALHCAMACDALEAGAHVICEKPMCLTYADAERMLATAKAAGRTLTIGHHMRYQPATVKAHEMIQQGALGQVYYVKASYLRRSGIPGYGSWFTNRDLAGGGAMMDIGCHMLDLSLWLMGHPKPVSVSASTYAKFGPLAKGLGSWGADHFGAGSRFDVDDLTTAFVRFADGSTLTIEASWATHGSQGQNLQIFGTEGGLELNANLFGAETPLHYFGDGPSGLCDEEVPLGEVSSRGHRALIPDWVEAIRAGKPPIIQPEHGALVVQIIEAAYKSAVVGAEIAL